MTGVTDVREQARAAMRLGAFVRASLSSCGFGVYIEEVYVGEVDAEVWAELMEFASTLQRANMVLRRMTEADEQRLIDMGVKRVWSRRR